MMGTSREEEEDEYEFNGFNAWARSPIRGMLGYFGVTFSSLFPIVSEQNGS